MCNNILSWWRKLAKTLNQKETGLFRGIERKSDNVWREMMEGEWEPHLVSQVKVKEFVFFLSKMGRKPLKDF